MLKCTIFSLHIIFLSKVFNNLLYLLSWMTINYLDVCLLEVKTQIKILLKKKGLKVKNKYLITTFSQYFKIFADILHIGIFLLSNISIGISLKNPNQLHPSSKVIYKWNCTILWGLDLKSSNINWNCASTVRELLLI